MPAHSYLLYLWNLVSIAVSFTVAPALAAYTTRLMPILRALFPIPLPVSVFKDTCNISFIAFFVFCSVIIPSLTTRIHYILIQTINFSLFLPYSIYMVHLQGKCLNRQKPFSLEHVQWSPQSVTGCGSKPTVPTGQLLSVLTPLPSNTFWEFASLSLIIISNLASLEVIYTRQNEFPSFWYVLILNIGLKDWSERDLFNSSEWVILSNKMTNQSDGASSPHLQNTFRRKHKNSAQLHNSAQTDIYSTHL